jgi:YhcH/YjgK/YiaL family protein
MIVDRIELAELCFPLHAGFATAFDFFASNSLAEMPEGRHAIDGSRLSVIIERANGRGKGGAKLEVHRRNLDIQICLAGDEQIGWRPLADCAEAEAPYNPDRDIQFFRDQPETWLALGPGMFAIFFPDDVHAPLAGEGPVHKAVFKLAVDWDAKLK